MRNVADALRAIDGTLPRAQGPQQQMLVAERRRLAAHPPETPLLPATAARVAALTQPPGYPSRYEVVGETGYTGVGYPLPYSRPTGRAPRALSQEEAAALGRRVEEARASRRGRGYSVVRPRQGGWDRP